MELSPVQRRIRDFYFKDALGAPRSVSHVHRAGLVPDQRLFTLADLRRHLNHPLLDLNYLNLFQGGAPVDLSSARLYKVVQRRKIEFVDHRVLQQHLAQGAACVLEGVDILEPEINALAAALDRAHAATFCNATVFFSQRGHEAYRGHLDTDDVLVIHLAGEKRWRLYRPQEPRRATLSDLTDAQMGPLETEVVMRPGDVLYLRSFTPHKVETLSECSLHLSFDLCDRQPSIEVALQLLLQHYDQKSAPRLRRRSTRSISSSLSPARRATAPISRTSSRTTRRVTPNSGGSSPPIASPISTALSRRTVNASRIA
jgi:hypothetical protein